MAQTAAQVSGRPFPKGKSPNPGGMPKGARQIQALISLAHGPKILTALQKLFEMGMDESTHTVTDAEGDTYEAPNVQPRVRIAALEAFVSKVGTLGGIEAVARQVGEEPEADASGLVERVVDGLLKKSETREIVKARLELVKP